MEKKRIWENVEDRNRLRRRGANEQIVVCGWPTTVSDNLTDGKRKEMSSSCDCQRELDDGAEKRKFKTATEKTAAGVLQKRRDYQKQSHLYFK